MLLSLLFVTALATGALASDSAGAAVIRAMHDRYAGRWYENLALVQTVTYYDPRSAALDSVRVWYESIRLPGAVRSDIAPLDDGNCILFLDERWIEFRADSVVSDRPGWHPVLLLGFDVYRQSVEKTLSVLRRHGIDLSRVADDEWQGREVYVVGDDAGQFWVDKEDLLFRRLLLSNRETGARREVRFDAYEPLGEGWIATELVFLRDGQVTIHERYDFWTIDVEFDPALFATRDRSRPAWVRN